MTTHLGRYLRPCCWLLVLAVVAPAAAEWARSASRLPAGYGAEGDRRRANPIPSLVRPAVERLTDGADGSWVKESVEGASWVYEVHVSRNGRSSVTRLTLNGHLISDAPEAESGGGGVVESGG
jgi:hypothetical protein